MECLPSGRTLFRYAKDDYAFLLLKMMSGREPFRNYGHPARSGDFPTLAWARLDFDLETGEALIEELQTDLLRDFQRIADTAYHSKNKGTKSFSMWGGKFDTARLIRCWENDFSAERAHWQEAMLTAALRFLVFEIGVRRIYYHTETTGAFLKNIRGKKPPRSLYTELPKRFCFDETGEIPQLLSAEKHWSRRAKAATEPMRFFKMAV
jgi:hypothetical protein